MKSLEYTLLIFILTIFFAHAQTNIRGRDCEGGRGTCMDIIIEDTENLASKTAYYTLYFILPENYFNQEDIEVIKDESKQFDFIIKEDVTMLDETLRQHNIPNNYNTVKSGSYPVTFIDDKYRILVTLTASKK